MLKAMDPDTHQPIPKPAPHKNRRSAVRKALLIVVGLLLLAAVGGGSYWYRDKSAKDDKQQQATQISALQKKVADLEKASKAKADDQSAATTTIGPSKSVIDNVKASITSGNTAALQGYMNNKVLVIIAASEGVGMRTSAEAVSDVTSYIKNATDPWDFNLSAATLNDFGAGDYSQYFPAGAVVGKSANNHLIAFSFNNAGKITVVFLSADTKLL